MYEIYVFCIITFCLECYFIFAIEISLNHLFEQ